MTSRRIRYAAPVVVTGLLVAGAWVPTLQASASPDLPAITAQHLVEKVLEAKVSHLSGSYNWTADLGLPSISDITGGSGQDPSTSSGFQATSLLSGTHTFEVWVDGATRQRIAAPGTLDETDLVHNGNQAWIYDSSTNHVTRYILRAPVKTAGARTAGARTDWGGPDVPATSAPTPATIADRVLFGVRSLGSSLSVSRPVDVAGRASYVLRIAPDRAVAANRASTISSVTIAVDARTGLPLRTAIYAVGQKAPALQVGFTSISYGMPSRSEFVAPKGQSTSTKVVGPSITSPTSPRSGWYGYATPSDSTGAVRLGRPLVTGSIAPVDTSGKVLTTRGLTTGELNAVRRQATAAAAASTPGGLPQVNARWAQGPVTLPVTTSATAAAGRHNYPVRTAPTPGARVAHNWGAVWTLDSGTMSRATGSELDSLTTVVSGRWGSGRLLTSTLVNALVLSDGRILVGAVTPAALEAAAAHSSR